MEYKPRARERLRVRVGLVWGAKEAAIKAAAKNKKSGSIFWDPWKKPFDEKRRAFLPPFFI